MIHTIQEALDAILSSPAYTSSVVSSLVGRERHILVLQDQLLRCRSILAPIHRLPEDVLLDIFALCDFQSTIAIKQCKATNKSFARQLVQQVCSAWHTLIIGTPALWDTLSLSVVHESDGRESLRAQPEQLQKAAQALKRTLERSSDTPLDVTIELQSCHSPKVMSVLLPVLQERHRWKHLSLTLAIFQLGSEVLSCLSNNLGLLETLEISISRYAWDPIPKLSSPWFSEAINLRAASLATVPLTLFPLPWAQLQSLNYKNFQEPHTESDIAILAQCRSIQQLVFYGSYPNIDTRPDVLLPLPIRKLSLGSSGDLELFSHFLFPYLSDLSLSDVVVEGLSPLLAQVAPSLQRLTLQFPALARSYFPPLFLEVKFPTLTELSIITHTPIHVDLYTEWDFSSIRDQFPKIHLFICILLAEHSLDDWYEILAAMQRHPSYPDCDVQLGLFTLLPTASQPIIRSLRDRGIKVISERQDLLVELERVLS